MKTLLVATALLCQGCFAAGYLGQAATGELGLLHAARPIPEVVTGPGTPARVKRLLLSVRSIKEYGQAQGLTPTRNYERYADLHRPAAVWVVQGCAPLAFEVRRWSFPLVGTIPYLGFFDAGAARRYADGLARDEGIDVDVRGAGAFSTLGWFHDPVLSTMIPEGDEALGELADVILHESVHATLYVSDQTAFNESLATFVADAITLPWLVRVLGPDAREARAWVAAQARHRTYVARMHQAYLELDALYRSSRPDADKLLEKSRLLRALQGELKLSRSVNNATLAGYRTYDSGGPAFARLLEACGGSWPRFLGAVRSLRPSDFGAPQQETFDAVLDGLAARGCAGGAPRAVAAQ